MNKAKVSCIQNNQGYNQQELKARLPVNLISSSNSNKAANKWYLTFNAYIYLT